MGKKFLLHTENPPKGGKTDGNCSGGPIFLQKKVKRVPIDSKS